MAPQKCDYWLGAHNGNKMDVETPQGTYVMTKDGCECYKGQEDREYYCSFGSFSRKEDKTPDTRVEDDAAEDEEEISEGDL